MAAMVAMATAGADGGSGGGGGFGFGFGGGGRGRATAAAAAGAAAAGGGGGGSAAAGRPKHPSSCRHASSYVSNCATSQTSQTYTLMMVGLVFWTSVAAAAAEGPIVLWSLGGAATAGGAGAGAATATAGNGSGGMGGADDADDSTASATCCAAAASDAAATDSSPPSGGGGGGPWLPGLLPLDPAGPDATAAAAPAADPKTATDGTETDAGWDGAAAGAVGTGPALLAAPAAAD
mmetsp:Transcript_18242/g.52168  ORF Transcript_18242/g.52168 Transcript_18242/m.52168 type:complete len:235 (+) Transcript_18242:1736-2440(+)